MSRAVNAFHHAIDFAGISSFACVLIAWAYVLI
jgi:hypothetical protein